MALFDDDTLYSQDPVADSSLMTAPSSGIGLEGSSGVGLETPAPVEGGMATPDAGGRSGGDPLSKLNAWQKAGLMLQSFSAGFQGKPSPAMELLKREREEKMVQLKEFQVHTESLQEGVKMAKNLQGDARKQFIDAYAKQLDGVRPDLGETFRSLSKQPDMGAVLSKYADKSPTLKRLIDIDPTGASALKIMASPDGMKTINAEIDAGVLPTLIEKANTFRMGWQQLVPPEMLERFNRDGTITASELMEANQWVKANKKDMAAVTLSDEDVQVINRNAEAFYGATGILGPKEEQALLKDRAKGDKAQSDIGKLRADLKAGRITQKEFDDRQAKLNRRGEGDSRMTPTTMSVDGVNRALLVDKAGNYFDANTRERVRGTVAPAVTASDKKVEREAGQAEATVDSVRARISQMSQQHESSTVPLVGPAGMARRIGETVGGTFYGGMDTPAIDYQNNVRLLASDVRKLVEKDPNLSKDEREALYEMMGGGILQTPGSAIRALNNVMKVVEGKAQATTGGIKKAVQAAGWTYEPDKYEYRMVGGIAQRKLKDK